MVLSLLGKSVLDGYVKNTESYKEITGANQAEATAKQKKQKEETLARFFAVLFLKNADSGCYGKLMLEYRQAYANIKRDLYPKDLTTAFDIMRMLPVKKKTSCTSQEESKVKQEKDPVIETSFVWIYKDKPMRKCYCCEDSDCLLTNCPKKDSIPKKEWFQETGKAHIKHAVSAAMVEVTDKVELGFSGIQKVWELQEPEVVLDSGSTISLFREVSMLLEIKKAHTNLLMETNAGTKAVT